MADLKLPSHRQIAPGVISVLKGLQAGDRITVVQTVRVGGRTWPATATGTYRGVSYLSTGVTVDRVAADDIVVPTVHFTKDNGELTSISLDENTKLDRAG